MSRRVRSGLRHGLGIGAALLDGVAVAALATGLAARHVRPEAVWWPQVVALAVPALTVGVASAGVWWAVRASRPPRGRRAAWALALAHLGLASVGLGREVGGWGQEGEGPVLTVLSLNIGRAPSDAPARLRRVLDAVDPDVVALQETMIRTIVPDATPDEMVVAAEPWVQPLLTHPDFETEMPETPARAIMREPVFVQGPILAWRTALLSGDENAGIFSRTETTWDGRRVAIYSLHLRSFGSARPWGAPGALDPGPWLSALGSFRDDVIRRAREAERFRRVLDAERLPYLVLGDFNSTPHQWSYHHLAAGRTDALRVGGPVFARTFPDRAPLIRIDGILASRHWRVRSARIGPEGLSDHRAVVAELTLVPGAAGDPP